MPLIAMAIYLLAPCPTYVCGGGGGASGYAALTSMPSSPAEWWRDVGFFFAGVFIAAGLGVPLLLAHTRVIGTGAALLSFGGGVVVYATISGYIHAFSTQRRHGGL